MHKQFVRLGKKDIKKLAGAIIRPPPKNWSRQKHRSKKSISNDKEQTKMDEIADNDFDEMEKSHKFVGLEKFSKFVEEKKKNMKGNG